MEKSQKGQSTSHDKGINIPSFAKPPSKSDSSPTRAPK